VVRPGIDPAAQAEFAPTSVATPGAMRDPTQASSRAVARSVAPLRTAAAPTGQPASQSGWLWGGLGIVAVGAVGGMLWMLFGPRDNVKTPALSALPSASATSAPTPKTATPTDLTAPEDAGADVMATSDASSVALPEGCDEATGACDCCPSGLECAAGQCTQLIAPDEGFHLRLAEVPMNGDKPLSSTHPSAEVCVKIADVARWTCLPIRELADGAATSHAYATMVDLTEKGIDVQVRFEISSNVHAPLASAERVTFPGAMRALVCKGLEVETQTRNVGIEKLRLYLDPDDSRASVPERKECP
jgi:hypothetical protein